MLIDERTEKSASTTYRVVGKPLAVKDAREKVSGRITYGVDLVLAGAVHGRILRSPHAHARVRRIDAARALAVPGVLGVVTHDDAPGGTWEGCWFNYRGKVLDGTARFVGDEVAAVAAVTAEIAEAALSLIEIDWEPLPAVFDAEEAMGPDAPELRVEGNSREPYSFGWGDVATGQAEADVVVECDIEFAAQQMASIGRNACIVSWEGDRVTLMASSQTPSELRDALHQAFGIPLAKIRVIAQPVGSSFGLWWSNNFMLITALLARKVGRPVRIELDNFESMSTVKRRHSERTRGRMGATLDGDLVFADVDHVIDNGAYGFKNDVGFFGADNWGRVRHGRVTIRAANTNTLTAGCMRGVGDVTLGQAYERLADMLAARLGIDPLEFRLRNQIDAGEELHWQHGREYMPGHSAERYQSELPEADRERWPEPFVLSSGSSHKILERGAEAFGWRARWRGWGQPTLIDGPIRRAIGVGTGIHCCGVEFEGNTSAVVRINPDGSAKVFASAGRQGQGSETTLSQVAAEALGLDFDLVEIEMGDTDSCPWSHGSIASNTMYRTGYAVRSAAMDAREQLLALAAREAFDDCPTNELDVLEGRVIRVETGENVELVELLGVFRRDALGQQSTITGTSRTAMPPSTTYARHFAAHFVEVEVDVETGIVRLTDYLACQDSGTVMNPQILKNQVIGGAICGAGFAIHEQLKLDGADGRVINGNLLDYKLLRTTDFPTDARVLFHESPDPVGPFGARGAGEAPIAAAGPAIAQAVHNALGGVWVDPPMTPERVVSALFESPRE